MGKVKMFANEKVVRAKKKPSVILFIFQNYATLTIQWPKHFHLIIVFIQIVYLLIQLHTSVIFEHSYTLVHHPSIFD